MPAIPSSNEADCVVCEIGEGVLPWDHEQNKQQGQSKESRRDEKRMGDKDEMSENDGWNREGLYGIQSAKSQTNSNVGRRARKRTQTP